MLAWAHSIRRWLELAAVIFIVGFLLYHFVFKPSSPIIPTSFGPINVDTSAFKKSVDQLLQKQADTTKKLTDLEAAIKQQQTTTVQTEIPQALKETDIDKSVERMKDAWKR